MLGLRGVNGFACGFKVNFFVPLNDGLSFDDDADVGVESLEFELLPTLELLLFTLFTLCGVVACGGVELGPCDFSE